jgi:hypothetical protein
MKGRGREPAGLGSGDAWELGLDAEIESALPQEQQSSLMKWR